VAGILSTGISGLRAFQRALDVTSHNIANANTVGYSRQSVEFATRDPERLGSYYLGNGVEVKDVRRHYDELLTTQLRGAGSTLGRLDAYLGRAETVNNLFADSTTGIAASMQRFANALQGVANEPASTAARQVLLSEAGSLQQRLQTYDRRLREINADVNSRLTAEAASITTTAANIARLNEQIISETAISGAASGELLDARDRQLAELSNHISVSVTKLDDGSLNVFVGNGQPLVVGTQATKLVTQRDGHDPERLIIAYQAGSSSVDLSSALSGGSVGGLMDFRREMLDPARNELGRIAAGLASVANAQHREGMDLYGNLGGDLFAVGAAESLPALNNAGTAALAVTRADMGGLTGANYVMAYDGSAWALRRADTGAPVTMAGAGTVGSPFTADGLSMVVSGAPTAGDSFLVRPTAKAVQGMNLLISDPARVAAAAPIRTSAALANTGSGLISAGEVLDATNPALRNTATIAFTSANTYSVNGAGSFAYTPGANIDVNGWRMQISGTPAVGDVFTVADNAGGVGDNRNALQLANMLGTGLFASGTESINAAVTRVLSSVGVATNQVRTGAEAQQVIVNDLQSTIDGISGVNLDEEAANMLRYQQAYQAAAQVIRITQDMFDALMRATGR
jgi:flagellar hook-associated protein 1